MLHFTRGNAYSTSSVRLLGFLDSIKGAWMDMKSVPRSFKLGCTECDHLSACRFADLRLRDVDGDSFIHHPVCSLYSGNENYITSKSRSSNLFSSSGLPFCLAYSQRIAN